jgi:citrate lyase subunit beta/citryl-CoA lyase
MHAPITPLFVPGDRPERFSKAAATEADAIIIDLEDAVDAARKDAARTAARSHDVTTKPVYLRINGAGTPWWSADLAAIAGSKLAGIVIPKAEQVADLAAVAAAAGPDVVLIPLIETVTGLDNVDRILTAQQVICVGFGSLDFGLDLGCEPSWEALLYSRSCLVMASRRAGRLPPIDGVTPSLDDAELIVADARRARAMGFGGKLAIHPKQVAPILSSFHPTENEVAWAERVLAAAVSDSAVKVDGQMIDKPLVERARRIRAAVS